MATLLSRVPRLPPELMDEIIDHLADDYDSLDTCALVCTAWLNRCRKHSWREVTLGPDVAHVALRTLLSTPSVGEHVRVLFIEYCYGFDDKGLWVPYIDGGLSSLETIRLPFLELLVVTFNATTHLFEPPPRAYLCSQFLAVKELRLRATIIPKEVHFQNLVRGLPNLESLDVWHITRGPLPPSSSLSTLASSSPITTRQPLNLRTLKMGGVYSWVIDWLLNGDTELRAESIFVEAETVSHMTAMGGLFRFAGPLVKHLELNFSSRMFSEVPDVATVVHCTQLRSLRFTNLSTTPDISDDFLWVQDLLSHVSSSSLEAIELHFPDRKGRAIQRFTGIETTLSTLPFEQLQSVTFELECETAQEQRLASVNGCFPLLYGRGILRVNLINLYRRPRSHRPAPTP